MSYNFVPDDLELFSFKCNQHILVQKAYIKHVRGFSNLVEDKYVPPLLYESYPLVNSYYEFAEDYDAVGRVPHLLFEQDELKSTEDDRSLESFVFESYDLESLETPVPKKGERFDSFVERKAQVQYLQTKPKCFVILGKPGLGEERLGKLLADYWRCVFISPEALIQEEIRSGGRVGLCIEFNLRCGRAISVDVIIRLLEQRLASEIVKHRGFVLCGFPLIANDLYTEDPLSSESAIFTAQEIFDDLIGSVVQKDTVKHVSRTSVTVESDNEADGDVPTPRKGVSIKEGVDVIENDPAFFKTKRFVEDANQMEYIMSLCEEHDYIIIYLKCSNEEVLNIRKDIRYDFETLQELTVQRERTENTYYSLFNEYQDEDNVVFDEAIDLKPRMLKSKRDFPAHVSVQLERYFLDTQLIIERYILLKHPEEIIRLDGRMSPNRLFRVLRLRLKVLPFAPSVNPHLLSAVVEFDEPGERNSPKPAVSVYDEEANEDVYLALRSRKALGPLYTWNLSIWNYACPVAMKEGYQIMGNGKYAVHFMNSIFFLSNEERCAKFLDNPRPYLLPPMPLTGNRVFIIGPPESETSGIAQTVQHFMDAEIIDFKKVKAKCMRSIKTSATHDFQAQVNEEALNNMKNKRRSNYEDQENERLAKVRRYLECIRKALIQLRDCLMVMENYDGVEVPKPKLVADAEESLRKLQNFKTLFRIDTPEDCQRYLDDESLIMPFLPEELQPLDVYTFDVVGPTSVCVTREARSLMRKLMSDVVVNETEIAKCLNTVLSEYNTLISQGKLSAWILDGFPPRVDLLQLLEKSNLPALTYILDDSSGGDALCKSRSLDNNVMLDLLQISDAHLTGRHFKRVLRFSWEDSMEKDTDLVQAAIMNYLTLLPEIKATLEQMECAYETIDIGNKPFHEVLTDLVAKYERMYNRIAKVVTREEKAQERSHYGDYGDIESGEYPGEEGDGDLGEESFRENRRLGNAADYDPVAYLNGVLWKGKDEFLVNYLNKMWLFATATNMNQFIEAPHTYDRHIVFNHKIPPTRICVVGNKGVGQTTQTRSLCKWLGLYYLDFLARLQEVAGDEGVEAHLNQELDESILQDIILPFWHDPNKRAVGFVFKGFPMTPKDVTFMINNLVIPDCIVELHMETSDLKERLLNSLLTEWRNQIGNDKESEKKNHEEQLELWQATRDREKSILLDERRQQRGFPRRHSGEGDDNDSERESLMSYMSYEEAEREKAVEAILQDQLPPPVLLDNWETEEQATERLRLAVDETTRKDLMIPLRVAAAEERIPWHVVDANMDEIRVYNSILQYLMPYLNRNQSFFERAYDVSIEMAEQLLEHGYYFLSRYGKTCPVQMYENYNPLQMYITKESQFQLFPLIYGHFIYFLAGSENREKFKKDVLKYVLQDYVPLPLLRARFAIIGPPQSGKSTVAERLCREYSLEHISIGKSVRRVLKYMPSSILAQRVRLHLEKGEEVPLDLAMQCVEAMTFEGKAVALGFVMDGLPNCIDEVKRLAQMNLVPHLVVDLTSNLEYIFKYMDVFGPTHRPEYSKKFIKYRFDEWLNEAQKYREWIDAEYQNCAQVSVDPSKWKTWSRVRELVLAVINEIKHYYRYCNRDMALRITNMLVTPYEFVSRQSQFKNYCPLCLYYENELTPTGVAPDRTGLISYHDKFYYLCPAHINEFEDDPDQFLGTNIRHELPTQLPTTLDLTEVPGNVYLQGYCAICLAQGSEPGKTFNMGSLEHGGVEYGDTVYLFDDPVCFQLFAKKPQLSCMLPSEVFIRPPPTFDMQSLPTLGMLEQYVASQIVKALIEVEAVRPLIPGLSIAQSAIVSLGLILKINNPNTPETHVDIFKKVKNKSMAAQVQLRNIIENAKRTLNPYLHYQEPLPPFKMPEVKKVESAVDSMYLRELIDSLLDHIEFNEKDADAAESEGSSTKIAATAASAHIDY